MRSFLSVLLLLGLTTARGAEAQRVHRSQLRWQHPALAVDSTRAPDRMPIRGGVVGGQLLMSVVGMGVGFGAAYAVCDGCSFESAALLITSTVSIGAAAGTFLIGHSNGYRSRFSAALLGAVAGGLLPALTPAPGIGLITLPVGSIVGYHAARK